MTAPQPERVIGFSPNLMGKGRFILARKIADITDPNHVQYIKKTAAQCLIRRLLADWYEYGVSITRRVGVKGVRLQAVDPALIGSLRKGEAAVCGSTGSPIRTYIPSKLPPPEIPGVKFVFADMRRVSGTAQLQRLPQVHP